MNRKEHEADTLLREVGAENGDRLLAKVRLADAIEAGDSGSPEASFALRAHLDFLMVNDVTSEPLFAVEIDGAQHSRDEKQRRRDLAKDKLCREAGLPLLRVNSNFAMRESKYVLLKYLCEAFYRSLAFESAQSDGLIPIDEPYSHASFIERDEETGAIYFGSIDARARAEILKLYERGLIPNFVPEPWIGEPDEWGDIHGEVYLGVGSRMTLVGQSNIRNFGFFGISSVELAEELAVLDLRQQIAGWLEGNPVGVSAQTFQHRFKAFVEAHQPRNYVASSGGDRDKRIPYPDFTIDYATHAVRWPA